MATENPLSFIFGGTSAAPSYQELLRRREIAKTLAARQRGFPKTAGEGLTYLGESLGDVIGDYRMRGDERAFASRQDEMLKGGSTPTYGNPAGQQRTEAAPVTPPTPVASENTFNGNPLAMVTPKAAEPPAGVQSFFDPAPTGPARTAQLAPVSGPVAGPQARAADDADADPVRLRRRQAVANIESDGSGGYEALGKEVQRKDGSVDRAYGKYQVMGSNIPSWTREALGYEMSPQQFLLDKKAQDKVFDHQFGKYASQYGEEGAARAWYAGPRGMNNLNATDAHGRLTVGDYGQRYADNVRNGVTSAIVNQQAPQGGGAQPGPTQAGPQVAPGTSPRAGGDVRVAALPPGAGGTMTDAEPEPTPTTIRPGPGSVPPGAGGVRIAPAPPAGVLAQARPGAPGALATDENALPVPGAAGAVPRAAPGAPPAIRAVGGSAPSLEAIPPASEQKMDAPGAPPRPPDALPYSPSQRRWMSIMNSRNVDEYGKAYAKQQFDAEEVFRKQLTERREADYVNEREKHEAKTLAYDKFVREAGERRLKQQIDRTGLENTRADLEKKYFEAGLPRWQAVEKADLEIQQARRTLNKPDEHVINGVIHQRVPGTDTYVPAPGSPKKEEKLTEKQMTMLDRYQRAVVTSGHLTDTKTLTELLEVGKGRLPVAGNYWVSDEFRRSKSAADTWLLNMIRNDSGAAIGRDEVPEHYHRYFPMPGDTEHDIRSKAVLRRTVEQAWYSSLGEDGRAVADKFKAERATRKAPDDVPEGYAERSPSTGKTRRKIGGHWEYD